MDLLLVVLLVLAIGVVVAVAAGRVGGGLAPTSDPLPPPLPEPVRAGADLDRARFGLALRGYRMDQVDAVLDEARELLVAKDEEIDRLRALGHGAASTPVTPGTPEAPAPAPAGTGTGTGTGQEGTP